MTSKLAQVLMANAMTPPVPERNPRLANLKQANQDMNLSPQEEALYVRHLDNLYGPGGVDNPDGSRSTLYQTSFDADGRTFSVPTVWDGQILPPDDAIGRAEQAGLSTFPSYPDPEQAQQRYSQMHGYMDKDMDNYLQHLIRKASGVK